MISSSSSTSGCVRIARTIATRCCCPARRAGRGYSSALAPSPSVSSSSRALARASVLRIAVHADGRERDVVEHGQVREQVEVLEHDADPGAHGRRHPPRGSVMSSPERKICPSSMPSMRFIVFSNVDLPEPEAPISTTTSCVPTARVDAAQHVVVTEALAHSPWPRSPERSYDPSGLLALVHPRGDDVGQADHRPAEDDEHEPGDDVRRVVVGVGDQSAARRGRHRPRRAPRSGRRLSASTRSRS